MMMTFTHFGISDRNAAINALSFVDEKYESDFALPRKLTKSSTTNGFAFEAFTIG